MSAEEVSLRVAGFLKVDDSVASTWECSQVSTWERSEPSALFPTQNPYTIATLYLYSLLLYCKPIILSLFCISKLYPQTIYIYTLFLHWSSANTNVKCSYQMKMAKI